MPYFMNDEYFVRVNALNGSQFNAEYPVSTPAPKAGIYRCTRCGHEIAIAEGHTLPPDNSSGHPKHSRAPGTTFLGEIADPMRWRLVAQAKHVHDTP